MQHAKKVESSRPGLVNLAIGLVNFVLTCNLPDNQVKFLGEFKLQKKRVTNPAHQKIWGAS